MTPYERHDTGGPAARGVGPIRVAVIDSDRGFVRVLVKRLTDAGWPHRVVSSPIPVEELVAMRLGAAVIDLEALAPHGWGYLHRVCGGLPDLGVVVCTSRSSVAQRVRGLRTGADDWVTKPAHPEEVIARVEAVVRRRLQRGRPQAAISAGELEIVPAQFQAFVRGASVHLTRREFELVQLLAQDGGRVHDREEIYSRVWGYAMARGDRSVDVFVRKSRQKLEQASPAWRYIHTHFGVGYSFAAEPVAGLSSVIDSDRLSRRRATTPLGDGAVGMGPGSGHPLERR